VAGRLAYDQPGDDAKGGCVTPLHALAVFAAGVAAGCVNVVVGSGSLVTFPTLVALGYAPVVANVSNTVGLVPGSAAGSVGYRRELAGQRPRVFWLAAAPVLGALIGGLLLLRLPPDVFRLVVPVLIGLACVLVLVQPRLASWLSRRRGHPNGGPLLWLGVFATGVYGGYFGAAQGVLLIALLGIFLEENLQRVNGLKNVMAMLVNATAAVLFIVVANVDWTIVACVAVGSTLGGLLGASVGRRLPPVVLRAVVVLIGLVAIVQLVG
jgi:uncharacterized protein